jgi:DNA-binding response OmpR family regulator
MDQNIRKKIRKTEVSKQGDAMAPRILLAEDDREMRRLMALMLSNAGYRVIECSDGISLLSQLSFFFFPEKEPEDVDLVISDIKMPGVTGMEMLIGSYEIDNFPPMILITAFGNEDTHADAHRFRAAAVFDKPFDIESLLAKVRELVPLDPSSKKITH